MVHFGPWFLQYLAVVRYYDGICRYDYGRLATFFVVELGLVDIDSFRRCCLEHIVECAQIVREILGEFRRYDINVCKANLGALSDFAVVKMGSLSAPVPEAVFVVVRQMPRLLWISAAHSARGD